MPANCELADVNGVCTQCAVGFVLFETQNLCVLLPPNCNEVTLEGLCVQCSEGFYLDEDGDCNYLI